MACGIPVVATRSGGPQQILTEATGILVAPDNPQELADAIQSLVQNPARRRALAAAGPVRVNEHFSLKRMLRASETLLGSLSAQRHSFRS